MFACSHDVWHGRGGVVVNRVGTCRQILVICSSSAPSCIHAICKSGNGTILAKEFSRELVPQDENDEPAEYLLARIRAERDKEPKARQWRQAKS